MRAKTLQILWHDRQPIYSCHFEPQRPNSAQNTPHTGHRVATSGGDGNVRLWRVASESNEGPPQVDYLCTLSRHTGAVNVVRFSPVDELIATAGDDCTILLWRPSAAPTRAFGVDKEEAELESESWVIVGSLRGTADIYDLAWSPDGQYIISASIDNLARIWNIRDRRCIHTFYGHHHYVQGVAWDPLGEYVATQSGDRTIQICRYQITSNGQFNVKSTCRHSRLPLTDNTTATTTTSEMADTNEATALTASAAKYASMYENETLTSFFRRLTFTVDGSLLITPAGLSAPTAIDAQPTSVTYLYARNQLQSTPIAQLPTPRKPSVAVHCSPVLYRLIPDIAPVIQLPYRLVYAVVSQDSITIYDTQQLEPLAILSNMHYATLTDLSWSCDGRHLMFTSTDGYCSLVVFEENELGDRLSADEMALFASRKTSGLSQSNGQDTLMDVSTTPCKPSTLVDNTLPMATATASSSMISTTVKQSDPSAPKKRRITPTLISKLPS
ncbi:WD40-repeat-containing domain protein [Syncephalis fuscata]|nr:WD40-repeat-containing domain protein [Syncephalis fuscata]